MSSLVLVTVYEEKSPGKDKTFAHLDSPYFEFSFFHLLFPPVSQQFIAFIV